MGFRQTTFIPETKLFVQVKLSCQAVPSGSSSELTLAFYCGGEDG